MDKSNLYEILRMAIVAFIGGSVGYLVRIAPTMQRKRKTDKLKSYFACVFISMFIGYVSFEIALSIIDNNGLCAAISGLCAFSGTEFLKTMSDVIKEHAVRKVKHHLKIDDTKNKEDKE